MTENVIHLDGEWHDWSEWRDIHPDEEVRWKITCEGTSPTNLGGYLALDEARGALTGEHERAAFEARIPKVHDAFLLGTIIRGGDGQFTIRPRWAETMIVDPETRKITLKCRCRTARGECKYQQVMSLDYLIVALTQLTYSGGDIHSGPVEFTTITWSVSEWLTHALDAEDQANYDATKNQAIAAYRARRKPEIVTDKKGQVIATLS